MNPATPAPSGFTPFDIWRRALSLDAALARFGGAEWAAETRRVLDTFDRLRTDPRHPLHDRADTATRLQEMSAAWEAQQRALRELRDGLRRRLLDGEALAVGFVRVGGAERLAAVPPVSWRDADGVDWERSTVADGVLTFSDVRVLVADAPRIDAEGDRERDRIES